MGEPKTTTMEVQVELIRPGEGGRTYHLPEGATLGDLLREAGATTTYQTVLVDAAVPEDLLPLHDGAVVTIVPHARDAAKGEPWRATILALQDDALFQEYVAILKSRRQFA